MSMEDVHVKQEPDWSENEDLSYSEAQADLYTDHQVKEELVFGPELVQSPKRRHVDSIYFNQSKLKICKTELKFEPSYGQPVLRDCEVRIERMPIDMYIHTSKTHKGDICEEASEVSDRDDIQDCKEIDLYFEQLTKPKPNLFEGYVRESVCEICHLPPVRYMSDLVQCKSCYGKFHKDCGKKEQETKEVLVSRGRKKKRGRNKDRKPKDLISDSGSHKESQHTCSTDQANSIDIECHMTVEAEIFETQWEPKLKELLIENQKYENQDMDWIEAGDCEIDDLKLKVAIENFEYKCNNCLNETSICFVCKSKSPKSAKENVKCQVAYCHKKYHLECLVFLVHWPQTEYCHDTHDNENEEFLSCPRHVCHTCVSEDPKTLKTWLCDDYELVKCVESYTPTTYHSDSRCLPAGTQILTGSDIICPRHYQQRSKIQWHVNASWCFVCGLGRALVWCEQCPAAFHAACLNIDVESSYEYLCQGCENGKLPLYGDIVWVKHGPYRWWPGLILHPSEISNTVMSIKHRPGEFVVRFFDRFDHYWTSRGRVFSFEDARPPRLDVYLTEKVNSRNSSKISKPSNKINNAFKTALDHARRACEILKKNLSDQEHLDIAPSPSHSLRDSEEGER